MMTVKNKKLQNTTKISELEPELLGYIQSKNPAAQETDEITYRQVLDYRYAYINQLLSEEMNATAAFNENYHEKIQRKDLQTKNLNKALAKQETFGDKIADKIAEFGGSWPFIITFIVFLLAWIVLNATGLFFKPFDKYPFILLNLALSCLAALQAPIIMMSQNRAAERDRAQADNDYEVNVKAEVEIDSLHQKLDYLMMTKWQHIIQLQQLQVELLTFLQEAEDEELADEA